MANEQALDARAALLAELDANPSAVLETFQRGKVLNELDSNPETRKPLRQLVAKKYPHTAQMMPETAVEQAVAPALLEIQQERALLAQERQKAQQEKAREEWNKALVARGISEKDLPKVTELAVKTANMDPEALALRWKAQNTPARATAGFGRARIPGAGTDPYYKGLMEDPDGWLLNRATRVWELTAEGRDIDAHDWSKEEIG